MEFRDGWVDYEAFGAQGDGVHDGVEDIVPTAERPFPYDVCRKVTVRGLTTASGEKPRLSPSERMGASTVVVEED